MGSHNESDSWCVVMTKYENNESGSLWLSAMRWIVFKNNPVWKLLFIENYIKPWHIYIPQKYHVVWKTILIFNFIHSFLINTIFISRKSKLKSSSNDYMRIIGHVSQDILCLLLRNSIQLKKKNQSARNIIKNWNDIRMRISFNLGMFQTISHNLVNY